MPALCPAWRRRHPPPGPRGSLTASGAKPLSEDERHWGSRWGLSRCSCQAHHLQKHFLSSGAHLLPSRTHSWTMTTACMAQLTSTHSPQRTQGQSPALQLQFCPGPRGLPSTSSPVRGGPGPRAAVGAPHQNSSGVGWLSSRDLCERGLQMRRGAEGRGGSTPLHSPGSQMVPLSLLISQQLFPTKLPT